MIFFSFVIIIYKLCIVHKNMEMIIFLSSKILSEIFVDKVLKMNNEILNTLSTPGSSCIFIYICRAKRRQKEIHIYILDFKRILNKSNSKIL